MSGARTPRSAPRFTRALSNVAQARRHIDRAVAHVLLNEFLEGKAIGHEAWRELRDSLWIAFQLGIFSPGSSRKRGDRRRVLTR